MTRGDFTKADPANVSDESEAVLGPYPLTAFGPLRQGARSLSGFFPIYPELPERPFCARSGHADHAGKTTFRAWIRGPLSGAMPASQTNPLRTLSSSQDRIG